jgi:hypothetical protein
MSGQVTIILPQAIRPQPSSKNFFWLISAGRNSAPAKGNNNFGSSLIEHQKVSSVLLRFALKSFHQ